MFLPAITQLCTVILVVMPPDVLCDVFTSLARVKNMVFQEKLILDEIIGSLPVTEYKNSEIEWFYHQRLTTIMKRNNTHEMERLNHPNGVYYIIKEFHDAYYLLRTLVNDLRSVKTENIFDNLADDSDLEGARASLIRLQEVYNMRPEDMINGEYLTYKGPHLTINDAFLMGKTAFAIGKYSLAVPWLTWVVERKRRQLGVTLQHNGGIGVHNFAQVFPEVNTQEPSLPDAVALLGRSLLRINQTDKAKKEYNLLKEEDFLHGDAAELRLELNNMPEVEKNDDSLEDFHRLCRLQSKTYGDKIDPRLRCRHAFIFLPYFRFKEEIISDRPYISLFYDVINDHQIETIKKEAFIKLSRGLVIGIKLLTTSARTSHTAFLKDANSKTAKFLTKRISYLTKLNTGINAAEDHQIVNYGLGGHYTVHMDAYEEDNPNTKPIIDNFGNRLSTFLIYLTDVERGGSTAFPSANLAVSPAKGTAVFWYNFNPAGDVETSTRHAACPVVIGEKWVINKWIWAFQNAFNRRCGLRPNASQLDIERNMLRLYRQKYFF